MGLEELKARLLQSTQGSPQTGGAPQGGIMLRWSEEVVDFVLKGFFGGQHLKPHKLQLVGLTL